MIVEPLLAEAVSGSLVSWWKTLLILPAFVGWAWLVATKLDKDARYYHLNHKMWNGIHMAAGIAALAATLLIPIFWLAWPAGIVTLALPVLAYWYFRDQAVPENQRFRLSEVSLSTKLEERRKVKAAKQALIQFSDNKGEPREVPLKDDPLYPIHILTEDLIGPALEGRAARIDITITPQGAVVGQTIDGLRYKRDPIAADMAVRLMDYLKEVAGLDVADRRRKQVGDFKLRSPSAEVAITLSVWGSSTGQHVRIDFDRATKLHKPVDGLGLLGPQLEALRTLEQAHDRHGVVLIGAPPGHGLSTTSYSFLARHDAYTSNVKSLEREVQVDLMGVDQVQWDPTNPDIDYATNLQSILRRDPDIVLTAEIKDNETARVAADPGMKGPLIYVQQPLATVEEQIRDWVKRVGDLKDATKALRAVTNQRLLRALCPNCRQAYQPTPEQIKKLNLPAKKVGQLYRASGKVQVKNRIEDCPVCKGTGYLGQTAAFQVMIVDDEVRKALAGGDLKAAIASARRKNMFYLQEAALSKVVAGETDIDEFVRVFAAPAASRSATPPKSESAGAPTQAQPTPAS